ncbi:MAG: alpha/beta hydrolase, partial [Saccharofermentans sp.]|nr:alpha/beta hydrolase [Saccharofermentans sp.]
GLTFEQQLADLDALVDYCCDRFGQDQVIILGHSYGSMLGSAYVMAHPRRQSCIHLPGNPASGSQQKTSVRRDRRAAR